MPSSVIQRFWYDATAKDLYIQFVSGLVYRYKAVPDNLYKRMRNTISKGKFFNRYIKGTFEFEQTNTN